MTEQTVKEEALPEKGPWSMGWKELAKASGNIVEEATTAMSNTVQKAVKTIKGPWDMDWQTLSSLGAKTRAPEPPIKPIGQEPPDYLDQVYSKLLNAETRTQHTDAKGNLITSMKGALGISQVMPKTGGNPGYGVVPLQDNSEQEYRRFGRDYLKAMVKEFNGDYEKAVAAYNAGASSVKKAITKAEGDKGDWKDYLPKRSETIPYIKKVLGESFTKENALKVAEYLPISGEILSAKDAIDEAGKGNYAAASLAAIGAIPGAGKFKKFGEKGYDLIHTIVDSKILSMGQGSARFTSDVVGTANKAVKEGNAVKTTLKKGDEVNLVRMEDRHGEEARIIALSPKGDYIGELSYVKGAEGFHPIVDVVPEWQRKGLATKMYDLAEQTGGSIPKFSEQGAVRTEAGQAFRQSRDKLQRGQ